MGVDIDGWIEVNFGFNGHGYWEGFAQIKHLADRNYGLFGGFFGVRNADEFIPLAANRGIPADASADVNIHQEPLNCNSSWILWSEIEQVDWQERAARAFPPDDQPLTRENTVTPGWRIIFTIMEALATRYGGQRVRLVVWFDSE
ncbi:MAG TPA: hypothetical protein VH393_16210 [Ktedonobacterales bacterium]|jgi:hypothetical protein